MRPAHRALAGFSFFQAISRVEKCSHIPGEHSTSGWHLLAQTVGNFFISNLNLGCCGFILCSSARVVPAEGFQGLDCPHTTYGHLHPPRLLLLYRSPVPGISFPSTPWITLQPLSTAPTAAQCCSCIFCLEPVPPRAQRSVLPLCTPVKSCKPSLSPPTPWHCIQEGI